MNYNLYKIINLENIINRLASSHEKGIFIIYNDEDLTKINLSLKLE